jgi:hypothetical protein
MIGPPWMRRSSSGDDKWPVFNFVGNLAWVLVLLGAEECVARRWLSGLVLFMLALAANIIISRWPELNSTVQSWRSRSPMFSTVIVATVAAIIAGSAWWFLRWLNQNNW